MTRSTSNSRTIGFPIPLGAQPPIPPNPSARPFDLRVIPPPPPNYPGTTPNPWDLPTHTSQNSNSRPRVKSMYASTSRSPPNNAPHSANGIPSILFPEPQIHRAASATVTSSQSPPFPGHRHSSSDLVVPGHRIKSSSVTSLHSNASSYGANQEDYDKKDGNIQEELSDLDLSLEGEEGLRRFQNGQLSERDQEWHRLVPKGAVEALGKQEVQRQSVLFEVIKSEREYVADLEAVQDVFINGLRKASPPIMRDSLLEGFIQDVFGNFNAILIHHQTMLAAFFDRQREQHPLIQSVADIVLNTTLKSEFRDGYEVYIKHYPLAESRHRRELKRNRAYEAFINNASSNPRIRKRDLLTFLSRPVTRLPRFNLLLEQILKLTDKEYEHPDLETLPIILGILSDCIKSTQPGIAAAESKVKFWALCESLQFQKGEIIDMDLYDDSRTLVHSGSVIRRVKTETGFSSGWTDLVASLLDNYFLLTQDEKLPNGTIRRRIMSRPVPLSYLRLGSFDDPPETRRERLEDRSILDSLRYQTVPIYPFTIYHASDRSTRRYTLFVNTDAQRKRWHDSLVDAIGVHRVRQEGNMWFNPQTVSDNFFRCMGRHVVSTSTRLTGKITSASSFTFNGRKFIVVACASGIFGATWGSESFRKILDHQNPNSIAAIQPQGSKTFNRFVVHSEPLLVSYSLDMIARVVLGQVQPQALEASMERIGGSESNIVFCRHVYIGKRVLLIYASKRRLGSTLSLHVLEAVDTSEIALTPRRNTGTSFLAFRQFGEPGFIPRSAYDVTALVKTVGICTHDGIVIADPTNLSSSLVSVVPDLRDANTNFAMSALKSRIDDAKPLGLVRVDASELLVIYDMIGCYITKHGIPSRSSGYIKWETKAEAYAHRGAHVLLFSSEFIEVRNITTGRIVQVIEGQDIRLLYSGNSSALTSSDDPILVAMRGKKDDADGVSERVVELVETSEFVPQTPMTALPAMWDEWDM